MAQAAEVAAELRVVVGQLVRLLREQAGDGGLTRTQAAVLGRLERDGPMTASALARAEGIRPQSMAAIVSALQSAGLVAGQADPSDGRKTLLVVTDLAQKHFFAGRLAREDWLTEAISRSLDPAELTQLSAGVGLLKKLL